MHNTHYIIVAAENESDAGYKAEWELNNFGGENNWYSIQRISCLSDNSDVEYIEQELQQLNQLFSKENVDSITELNSRLLANPDRSHYFLLSENFKKLYELTKHTDKAPYTYEQLQDIDDYFGWEFDEYGITNMSYGNDLEEYEKFYLVTIDMHS